MKPAQKSRIDWARVKRESEVDTPIPYAPEDGPYDPNDEAATDAYLSQALIRPSGQRGLQKSPTKQLISIRLSPEVLQHFRATGDGWQSRIDDILKKSIKRVKL